jgi:2-C-methyl-D-erythritol 4-phosphate cytidylyltransferase
MKVIVLIPAAGLGRRMGGKTAKQYLDLAGRPLLAHTLALFELHPQTDRIFVISPPNEAEFCRNEVIAPFGFAKVHGVVSGGAERQDSVRNGLMACGAEPDDVVLVHDGVRPFLPPAVIGAAVDTAARTGSCVVGIPVRDTIKEVANGRITRTCSRDHLWQAQTPQAFRYQILREAHELALRDGYRGTDEASLVERLGFPIEMVLGSCRNIKITTPDDLYLAQALHAMAEGAGT